MNHWLGRKDRRKSLEHMVDACVKTAFFGNHEFAPAAKIIGMIVAVEADDEYDYDRHGPHVTYILAHVYEALDKDLAVGYLDRAVVWHKETGTPIPAWVEEMRRRCP